MHSTIATSVIALLLFVVGIVCLIWPRRIQEYVLSMYQGAGGLRRYNPFLGWMRTEAYIISLRVVGILAIVSVVLIVLGLIKRSTG